MELIVLSIFDVKGEVFGLPHFVQSIGHGIRSFNDECNRQDTPQHPNVMYNHPEDFHLYALGKYDDSTGQFLQESSPKLLITASQCRNVGESKISKV